MIQILHETRSVLKSVSVMSLHEEALKLAKNYFRAEAELLVILQKIDAVKAFRNYGCTSLFQYAVTVLNLSESTAFNFINVARKAVQVPQLKVEIENGNLSVSKARKIVPVLNQGDSQESQREWIEKAKTLNSKKLEQEVARAAPKEETPESARFVTGVRRALKLGMDEAGFQNLKRVQDLESQRQKKAVSLEEAIVALTKFYLEAKDPVLKAERAVQKMQKKNVQAVPSEKKEAQVAVNLGNAKPVARQVVKRTPIPAVELHQVRLRDQTQCTHIGTGNRRCDQRRWLEIHHLQPLSQGGKHELSNLTTLCSSHHREVHGGSH